MICMDENSRCRGSKSEVRSPKFEVRGPRSEVRGSSSEVQRRQIDGRDGNRKKEKGEGRRSECDPRPSVLGLEQVPQTELHVATGIVFPGDPAERGARWIRARVVQVRMVQEIEDLCPELHRVAAAHGDV